MEVHPIFTVAMLEPAPPGPEPYERPIPEQPDSVHIEGDTDEYKSWEIEEVDKQEDCSQGRWVFLDNTLYDGKNLDQNGIHGDHWLNSRMRWS